jgi:hypothetical protein
VIDPQPSPAAEPAPATQDEPSAGPRPLVLLTARDDDALVCVDDQCLPAEADR